MKVSIKKETDGVFKPFSVSIEFESLGEARIFARQMQDIGYTYIRNLMVKEINHQGFREWIE